MAGFFANLGKRDTFSAVIFLIVLHFLSGVVLSYVNEEALLALIRKQAVEIYQTIN